VIQTWHVKRTQSIQLDLEGLSLDAVTRQLPEGYYSTFRTYHGGRRVLGLTGHMRRLFDPVSDSEIDAGTLRRRLRALLESHYPGEARVRAVMTSAGNAYLAIEPLQPLPKEVYEKGVRVETSALRREHPRLKSTAFIGSSDAERQYIARQGIFEALLIRDGRILEGMTSNFFYVQSAREKVLGTAREDILPGVTRETVIEIARGRGLEVKYEPLKPNQIEMASEAFITSSSRGIVPVIQIDHVTVGEGRPGPVTNELMAAYEEYVLIHSEEI
jgi:branched-subunit amino acid aminotransferase/4-amino-4-deoxychorismate lyase